MMFPDADPSVGLVGLSSVLSTLSNDCYCGQRYDLISKHFNLFVPFLNKNSKSVKAPPFSYNLYTLASERDKNEYTNYKTIINFLQ